MKQDEGEEALLGAWRLVALEVCSEEGQLSYPMGRSTEGQLLYLRSGEMSMHIMRPGRPPFDAGERLRGSAVELRLAFEGYLAYWGTYEVDAEVKTISHTVRGSLFPNWIGTRQVREYELEASRLLVVTPPMPVAGRPQSTRLVWER